MDQAQVATASAVDTASKWANSIWDKVWGYAKLLGESAILSAALSILAYILNAMLAPSGNAVSMNLFGLALSDFWATLGTLFSLSVVASYLTGVVHDRWHSA